MGNPLDMMQKVLPNMSMGNPLDMIKGGIPDFLNPVEIVKGMIPKELLAMNPLEIMKDPMAFAKKLVSTDLPYEVLKFFLWDMNPYKLPAEIAIKILKEVRNQMENHVPPSAATTIPADVSAS